MSGAVLCTIGAAAPIIDGLTGGLDWAKTVSIKLISVLLLIMLIRYVVDQMRT